jgi:hypothetical protein
LRPIDLQNWSSLNYAMKMHHRKLNINRQRRLLPKEKFHLLKPKLRQTLPKHRGPNLTNTGINKKKE